MEIKLLDTPIEIRVGGSEAVLVLEPGDRIQLGTTASQRRGIFVCIKTGKDWRFSFSGGAEIIGKIQGEGMAGKVEGAPSHSKKGGATEALMANIERIKERSLMIIVERIVNRHYRGLIQLDVETFKLFDLAKRIHSTEDETVLRPIVEELNKP